MRKVEPEAIRTDMFELRREIENVRHVAERVGADLVRRNEDLLRDAESLRHENEAMAATAGSLQGELDASRNELAETREQLAKVSALAEQELSAAREQLAKVGALAEQELSAAREQRLRDSERSRGLVSDLSLARREMAEVATYAAELEARLREVLASRSWRMMGVIRALAAAIRRLLYRKRFDVEVTVPDQPASLKRALGTLPPANKLDSPRRQMGGAAKPTGSPVNVDLERLRGTGRVAPDHGSTWPLRLPVDFHRLASDGQLLPKFGALKADRKLPSGFPFELLLPPPIGSKNDFGFLLDAIHQQGCTGDIPCVKLGIVVWIRNRSEVDAISDVLSSQTLPRERFEVTVFLDTDEGVETIDWADRVHSGSPWRISADEQLNLLTGNADVLVFLDGTTEPDCQFLERVARYASASSAVMLGFVVIEDGASCFASPYSDAAAAATEDWRRARFPFRNVQSLNFAIPVPLFRSIGGFEPRFQDYRRAAMELGYRAYNRGAYFIPMAIAPRADADDAPIKFRKGGLNGESKLFESLCPVHWYRRKDGSYEVPKVSVYIPAYNAASYICDAIDSVLGQDFKDVEVCVHVDGSPDDTLEVLERTYSGNARVRWSTGENAGIGHASNRAIQLARGMYIGQLDSDDRLKPGALRKLVDYLDNNGDVGCVYSSCERVDAKGDYLQDEYSWPEFSHEKMMMTSIVHHFRMFRRQAWERTEKFRETLTNAVDYDMFLKLSEVGGLHHIDRKLYQRRWHGGNTSSVNEERQTNNTYIVQTLALERQGLADAWQVSVPDKSQPRRITYTRKNKRNRLFFWPDYSRANPYQRLLYRNSLHSCDFYAGDIDAAIKAARDAHDPEQIIFHIHWLNPLVQSAKSEGDLRKRLDSFLHKVKKLQWLGGKVVWTIHNCVSHDSGYAEVECEFSGRLAAAVDKVHVHAGSSIAEIMEHFPVPSDNAFASPHGNYCGIYPNYIPRELARAQLGLGKDDMVVLFFGQIRPYKGLESLFAACSGLIDQGHPVKLVLAGRASYDVRRQLALSKDLADHVLVIDRHIDDSEIQVLFKAADVGVFPYRRILTSGSLMLSISFGLPAVVPSVGMTRDVLEGREAGILYGPGSQCASLDEALEQVIRLKAEGRWEQYRLNAAKVAGECSWPDFVAKLHEAPAPGSEAARVHGINA